MRIAPILIGCLTVVPFAVAAEPKPLSNEAAVQSMLDRMVPEHPLLIGYAGVGFGLSSISGDYGSGLGGALRVDSNLVAPLWGTAKLRLVPGGSMQFQGDASLGWVLSTERKLGMRTWSNKVRSDAYYDYYRVYGTKALIRDTYVISSGIKIFSVEPPVGPGATQMAITAGVQHHDYSHYGDRTGWEVQALWNPAGGSFGAILEAHAGIPLGYPRFTIGGQLGFLPTDGKSLKIERQFVIAMEVGWNFGS